MSEATSELEMIEAAGANGAPTSRPEILETDRLVLRAVSNSDYELLRRIELSPDQIQYFRHRGTTPSPEQWLQSLWQSAVAQFLMVEKSASHPVGFVSVHQADFRNQTAYLSVNVFRPFQRFGWPLWGVVAFVDYVFDTFPLRKLYATIPEPNMRKLGPLLVRTPFVSQGTFDRHEYIAGEYVDVHIYALWADEWRVWRQSSREASGFADAVRRFKP